MSTQGQDEADQKKNFFHGAGERETFRVSPKTPLPKNAALNKKLIEKVKIPPVHSLCLSAAPCVALAVRHQHASTVHYRRAELDAAAADCARTLLLLSFCLPW